MALAIAAATPASRTGPPADELSELVIEADAAARHLLQVHARLGAHAEEAFAPGGATSGVAAVEQLADVGWILDVAALVPQCG
jgi:hypothetical protein